MGIAGHSMPPMYKTGIRIQVDFISRCWRIWTAEGSLERSRRGMDAESREYSRVVAVPSLRNMERCC